MYVIHGIPLELGTEQTHRLPINAQLLTVQMQGDTPYLWALVDPEQPPEDRHFLILLTGQDVGVEQHRYIATFQDPPFTWHVFEIVR